MDDLSLQIGFGICCIELSPKAVERVEDRRGERLGAEELPLDCDLHGPRESARWMSTFSTDSLTGYMELDRI